MLKSKLRVRLAELETPHQDFAATLGVTKQTMSLWVTGKAKPTLEMAFKIANLLDCKVDDLFVYIGDK